MAKPRIVILAGPNGAGKTSLYTPLVDRWKEFDNYAAQPVLIARGTRNRKLIIQEQAWQTLTELAQKA